MQIKIDHFSYPSQDLEIGKIILSFFEGNKKTWLVDIREFVSTVIICR